VATLLRRRLRPKVGTVFEATASLAALALGTPIPLGTIARLLTAIGATEPALKEWEERLVAGVAAWLGRNPAVGSDLLEGWEDRLVRSFNDAGAATFVAASPHARDDAVELIARAVFVPYTKAGWDDARDAARALLDALPELLLEAAGDGEFAALRTVLGDDLACVLEAIDDLGDRLPPRAAEEAAVAAYLGGLRAVLDVDPWAGLIGGPARTLETGFVPRRVKVQREAAHVDDVADACDRLVVLGEPGSGKTWLARYLAIRAADRALARLTRTGDESFREGRDALGAEIELPLVSTASAVLDAPSRTSPWDALVDTSIGALGDHLGPDGVASLRLRLGRRSGSYLVILDGLDEAARHADATTLARLLGTPGPVLRVLLTSRPAVWRGVQLPLDAARHGIERKGAIGGHAVVSVEPLGDEEVREAIADLLAAAPDALGALTATLDADERLATFARTPLACVMLCAMVAGTGSVPRGRTMLYRGIVSLLLRSSWRREVSDEVVREARIALQQLAVAGAEDDPSTDLCFMHDLVALPLSAALGPDAAKSVDAVAPVATFDAAAPVQQRRFIHASLRTHLIGEHVASLDAQAAAARLRHHLWFDPDWRDAVPAALALHTQRSTVLRTVLDVAHDRRLTPLDVQRLDGFGELGRLLVDLARESNASDWEDDCRDVIVEAVHTALDEWTRSLLRLELVRGGWPDDCSRHEHLQHIASGTPLWPIRDIRAGIESLALDQVTRRALATELTGRLDELATDDLEVAGHLLDALCGDDLEQERRRALAVVSDLVRRTPISDRIEALLTLRPPPEQTHAVAEAIVGWLEDVEVDEFSVFTLGETASYVTKLTADERVLRRGAFTIYRAFEQVRTPTKIEALGRAAPLVRTDPDACARVFCHVLLALDGLDSYDTGRMTAVLGALMPERADAASVLSALLEQPASKWPHWRATLDVLADIAAELEPAAVDTLLAELVARFGTEDLADLVRLADVVDRLEAGPTLRDHAAQVLLDRLRETPRAVILSCALVLRTFARAEVAAAAAEILHEHLVDETDRQFRFSLADGVLWFAREGRPRADAIEEVVNGIDVAPWFAFHHVRQWFAETATPDERVRFFEAFAQAFANDERALAGVAVPSDLRSFVVPDESRRTAAASLLRRLRLDPATYPSDWLPLAAEFGAANEELEEANDLVVAAIPEMDLHDGSCHGLLRMWEAVELTVAQREAAAGLLVQRLGDVVAPSLTAVVGLLLAITPSRAIDESACAILRARLEAEDEFFRDSVERALHTLNPTAEREAVQARDVLAELKGELGAETAERVEAAQLTEDERQHAIRALTERALGGAVEWYELDRLDVIADALAVSPLDLEPVLVDQPSSVDAIRRLARSARSRCSGEEWRAFLTRVAEGSTADGAAARSVGKP
jgi:hypothetical protein